MRNTHNSGLGDAPARSALIATVHAVPPNGVRVIFTAPATEPGQKTARVGKFYGARSMFNEIAHGLRQIGHPLEERAGEG